MVSCLNRTTQIKKKKKNTTNTKVSYISHHETLVEDGGE